MSARSCALLREETAAGRVTAKDTLGTAIARAREVGADHDGLNVFVWRDDADALKHAETIVDRLADTTPDPLLGVPVAIKDNIATLAMPTTCGTSPRSRDSGSPRRAPRRS